MSSWKWLFGFFWGFFDGQVAFGPVFTILEKNPPKLDTFMLKLTLRPCLGEDVTSRYVPV